MLLNTEFLKQSVISDLIMEKYLLHEKVLTSDIDGVKSLILTNINLNQLDEQGNSALHWAVLRGDDDIVQLLLEAGANPNILSEDGFTPKWSAVDFGLTEIIEILDSFGGKVITDNRFDRTSWTVFKNLLGQDLPNEEKE